MTSFVRCRFGAHDPVAATIGYAYGEAFVKCSSSSSEAYGRTETGYEFVSRLRAPSLERHSSPMRPLSPGLSRRLVAPCS